MRGLAQIVPNGTNDVGGQHVIAADVFDNRAISLARCREHLHSVLSPRWTKRSHMETAARQWVGVTPRPRRKDHLWCVRRQAAQNRLQKPAELDRITTHLPIEQLEGFPHDDILLVREPILSVRKGCRNRGLVTAALQPV